MHRFLSPILHLLKNNLVKIGFSFLFAGFCTTTFGQLTIKNLGTSRTGYSNAYGTRQGLACYPAQNLVGWVHRSSPINNTIKMDVSMDGGNTWVVDKVTSWGVTPGGRLPKMAFFNPSGNTIPSNVWATAIVPIVSNTARNSYGTTVVSVATAGGTVLNIDTPLRSRQDTLRQITSSVVSLSDRMLLLDKNGSIGVGNSAFSDTLTLTKLTPSGNRFNYSTQFLAVPMTAAPTLDEPGLPDVAMAFNESGSKGYIVGLGHQSYTGADTGLTYLPVVLSSTDGGDTWSSPTQLSISALVRTALGVTWNPTCGWELSATVDQNGNLHILTSVSRSLYSFDTIATGASNLAMVDIVTDGSTVLSVKKLGNPNSYRGLIGLPTTGQLTSDLRPCASRNLSGDKLFFNWFETQSSLSTTNNKPDWWMAAYDVASGIYTTSRNMTAGTAMEGKIIFGSAASHVLSNTLPNGTTDYEVPVTYTALGAAGSLADSVFHKYIQGGTVSSTDFLGFNFVSAIGSPAFCSGDTVFLTTTATSGNQWYRNGVSIPAASSNILRVTRGGSYFNVTGVDTSNTLVVTEIPRPLAPLVTPSSPSYRYLCDGDSVAFSSSWSTDTILQWWNHLQLLDSHAVNGTRVVKTPGIYFAKKVFNGCISSSSEPITVVQAPVATTQFQVSDSVRCLFGNTFSFSQSSSIDSGSFSWKWYWGDGDSSQFSTVQKSYQAPGIYSVQLKVTSSYGCVRTYTQTVQVLNQDSAKLNVVGANPVKYGDSVLLQSASVSGNQWLKYQSALSGKNNPQLWVKKAGSYALTVEKNGCRDTSGAVAISFLEPQTAFHYQAVLLDSKGKPWPRKTIGVQLNIKDSTTIEYQELQSVTTDSSGYFSLFLGKGAVQTPSVQRLGELNWGDGQTRVMLLEVDTNASSNYYPIGSTALVSVPMAAYAYRSADEKGNLLGIFYASGEVAYGDGFGVKALGNQRFEITFFPSFSVIPLIFVETVGSGNYTKKILSVSPGKALLEITGQPDEIHFRTIGK
jgi:hypothetical protein